MGKTAGSSSVSIQAIRRQQSQKLLRILEYLYYRRNRNIRCGGTQITGSHRSEKSTRRIKTYRVSFGCLVKYKLGHRSNFLNSTPGPRNLIPKVGGQTPLEVKKIGNFFFIFHYFLVRMLKRMYEMYKK